MANPTPHTANPQPSRRNKTPDPNALLWSIDQAAAALGVSTRSLKRADVLAELPPGAVRHLGRRVLFSRLVLEAWLSEGGAAAQPKRTRGR
jgi:hypothetical protein